MKVFKNLTGRLWNAVRWRWHLAGVGICRRKLKNLFGRGYALSSPEITRWGERASHHSAALERMRMGESGRPGGKTSASQASGVGAKTE